jgi:antitoxin component YwqK of YwqJK toxin-antitoxin module
MRTIPTVLILALTLAMSLAKPSAATAQDTASPEQMEERGGLVFKSSEQPPFTGTVQDFHQSGKPRLEARYEAGKLVSSTVWYDNGQVAEQVSVVSDTWTIRRFGDTGRLEEETVARFQDGHKVSEETKRWDEDGRLRTEAGFEKGKLQGPLKEYDASGNLTRDEVYEQGKLVKKIK